MVATSDGLHSLATYQRCVDRIAAQWRAFASRRADRLRTGDESEMVTQAILDDLFAQVLDWPPGDIDYQRGRADIVLTHNLAKQIIIEAKRPGTFSPSRLSFEKALNQARRYADAQKVLRVAASDGRYIYAADVIAGTLKDRTLVDLACEEPPCALWWLSVHGIYRDCVEPLEWPHPPQSDSDSAAIETEHLETLHPKYKIGAHCFAYVGDANRPATWRLPYLNVDGSVDAKRLPKAIQCLLSNYRGAQVQGIPHEAVETVLLKLAKCAEAAGRMPPRAVKPAQIYCELATVLAQRGLCADVGDATPALVPS